MYQHTKERGSFLKLFTRWTFLGKEQTFYRDLLSSYIRKLSSKASELGYDFRLVTISRPTKPLIEVEWFDEALLAYFIENPLAEIDEIATHVSYDDAEATIEAIEIADHQVTVTFNGTLDVEAQYGSNSDIENDIGLMTSYCSCSINRGKTFVLYLKTSNV